MKRKIKIVFFVMKKATKKLLRIRLAITGSESFYKDKSLAWTVKHAFIYPARYGVKATLSKLKKEMLRVSRGGVSNHHFPNGLVSGIDETVISRWVAEKPVSIVIPSYNDFDLLSACIKSIHQFSTAIDYEIIVVDDYCVEENRVKLRTLSDEKTRIIFRERNGGFSKAVNTGLRVVPMKNDVVILNSDIVAHENWLTALQYGAYEFGEKVGIVGPKLLYPDGRIQSAGSFRNTESPEWFDHYYRFQDSNYGPANVPQYCLGITGACQYVTREFIDSVGILDEGFEFAFEDMDYCLRGWEKGFKTLYFPASTLTHHESATRPKNKDIGAKEKKSVVYFWKKWGDWFDKRNVKNNKNQTRIIFVLQTLGYSGGIKNVIEHANRLSERNFDTEVWSLDSNSVWPVGVPTRSFKNYKALQNALSKEEAIKVATWWETSAPVWLASVKKGIAVNFIQEIESWFYPNDIAAQRTVLSCYRKEFKNLTISNYNKDEISQLGLHATMIPCGYEPAIYYKVDSIKKEKNVLLGVGRSFFQKNFSFSFDAWKRLGEKRPDFWLFGTEPDLASLDKKITYFAKPTDEEVNTLYNKSTVFIQTSRHEGFCLPILEAMAAGTPVICTDAHGNRDFSIDGKTCIMVDQDDTKALSSAISKLFEDEKLQRKLIKNGLSEVKKYRWSVITDRLEKYYIEVASQSSIFEKVQEKYGK